MTTLFIEADEPLLVFPSIEVAERDLEAIDVRDGVYSRALGPGGELFSITTEGEKVLIRPLGEPADPEGLRALLLRSLRAVGEEMEHDADLPSLVAAAEAFWEERDPFGDRFSTPIPLWGCLFLVAAITGAIVLFWR